MNDAQLLLKAIILNPKSDIERLCYADEIESTQPDRAEMIRVQIELSKWPMRKVISKDDGTSRGVLYGRRGGPDYYEIPSEVSYYNNLKVGDRVDILLRSFSSNRKCKWMYGLRVSSVSNGADTDTFLVKDSKSIPEPSHISKLREREMELRSENVEWAYPDFACSSRMTRGFISDITCTAEDFNKHADELISNNPIEKIVLTTLPDWEPWSREECLSHLSRKYKGIEFVLPPTFGELLPTREYYYFENNSEGI